MEEVARVATFSMVRRQRVARRRKVPVRESYTFISCLFFFSSRRRHTRCSRDWSSDVCSSDLHEHQYGREGGERREAVLARGGKTAPPAAPPAHWRGHACHGGRAVRAVLGRGEIGRASCRERV